MKASALCFAEDCSAIAVVKSTISGSPRARTLYRSFIVASYNKDKRLLLPSGGRSNNPPGVVAKLPHTVLFGLPKGSWPLAFRRNRPVTFDSLKSSSVDPAHDDIARFINPLPKSRVSTDGN